MASNRLARRRISAAVGGAAIIAMIAFTASCSSDSDKPEESPTKTTTTTTTEPSLTPTEKSIGPSITIFTPPPPGSQYGD
ncbi:MAG: hypothetical protein WBO08_09660 [Mycobacterium sp.]